MMHIHAITAKAPGPTVRLRPARPPAHRSLPTLRVQRLQVGRILGGPRLRPKVTIGPPDDARRAQPDDPPHGPPDPPTLLRPRRDRGDEQRIPDEHRLGEGEDRVARGRPAAIAAIHGVERRHELRVPRRVLHAAPGQAPLHADVEYIPALWDFSRIEAEAETIQRLEPGPA